MAKNQQYLTLNTGDKVPQLGFGTWNTGDDETILAVETAIDAGYRHIDTAYDYKNEKAVGQAIRNKIAAGVVKREEMWVTTKLWNSFHKQCDVVPACKAQLEQLGLDYVDLYLIHWPMSIVNNGEPWPLDDKKEFIKAEDCYTGTWKGMEECNKLGLARNIGISNFNTKQMQEILDVATIKPAMLQIESQPNLVNEKVFQFAKAAGMQVTAYSPLGSPGRSWASDADPKPMEEECVKQIAAKHGKQVAQVLIRFQIQRGLVVIPKSATPVRIAANMDAWDWCLEDSELEALKKLDKGHRMCSFDGFGNLTNKFYPFHEKE